MTVLPGLNAEDALAGVIKSDPRIPKETSAPIRCLADVWVHDAQLVRVERPGCLFPSPELWLTGSVLTLYGNMPYGVTAMPFANNEVVADVAAALDEAEESQIPADGINPASLRAKTGPEVMFVYEFTPKEKAELVAKGLMEPGFEVPDVFTQNRFERLPLECTFTAVPPEVEGGMPILFADIQQRYEIPLSTAESQYRLVDEFEMSEVMRERQDVIMPVVDEIAHEQMVEDKLEDDFLAAYGAAEIEATREEEQQQSVASEQPASPAEQRAESIEEPEEAVILDDDEFLAKFAADYDRDMRGEKDDAEKDDSDEARFRRRRERQGADKRADEDMSFGMDDILAAVPKDDGYTY